MTDTSRGYPLIDITMAAEGPFAVNGLAEAVDADVETIHDRVTFLESINPLGHMGRTAAFQTVSTNTRVAMDSAQLLRGGMTFDTAADALVVPLAGYYYVSIHLYASGPPGYFFRGQVSKNAGLSYLGPKVSFWKEDSNDYFQSGASLVLLAAGDKLSMVVNGTGNVWGSNGFDGCFIEAEYRGPVS